MSGLIAPYYRYIGFSEQVNDPHLRILARSDVLPWACRLDVPECIQDAQAQFAIWKQSSGDTE